MTCQIPPEGWFCIRAAGHDGPCAARALDALPDDPPAEYADASEAFLCTMAAFSLEASPDEMRALLAIAARVSRARSKYGPLTLSTDKRKFSKELNEELLDASFYGAILTLGDEP